MALVDYPSVPDPDPLVDRIVSERGAVLNLYRMLLHNPGITEGWLRLGTAVNTELSLDHRTREIVVCAVARATGAEYEWSNHAPAALRRGVTEAELVAIRSGDRTPFGDRDRALLEAVEVIGDDPAKSETYIDALRTWFDARAIAELVFLVGFYWMVTRATLALQIEHDTVSWGETDAALDG